MIAFPDGPRNDGESSTSDPPNAEIIQCAATIRRGWSVNQTKRRGNRLAENTLPHNVSLTDVIVDLPSTQID